MSLSPNLTVEIVPTAADLARAAANRVSATVANKPDAVIALPTGSTPLGLFAELVARERSGALDLNRVRFFCLDEYVGVAATDPNSLTGWLFREFFTPAGISTGQVAVVPSTAADLAAAAASYEAQLRDAGGLDLVILGIGPNGHIAFNEPGSARDSRTRILDLTPESRAQAAAYWDDKFNAPRQAMTMGIATLLEARDIVLIAAGASKRDIVHAALTGPISDTVPASWLRTAHDRVTIILDQAAAPTS